MEIKALEQKRIALDNELHRLENAINAYIDGRRDTLGLVLEEVKTPAYKALKSEYNKIFSEFREFNGKYAKTLRQARNAS